MYEDHGVLTTPADSRTIWRYRPLEPANRLGTILKGKLYHSRLDQLQDEYEGRFPQPNHNPSLLESEARRAKQRTMRSMRRVDFDTHPRHSKRLNALREQLEAATIQLSEDELIEAYIRRHGDLVAEDVRRSRKTSEDMARSLLFVNCWQLNDYESDVMWRAHDPEQSVAVRSSVGGLKRALSTTDYSVYIGKVRYIDSRTALIPVANLFNQAIHKWVQYKHEEELRTVIMDSPPPVPGGDENTPADWLWSSHPTGLSIEIDVAALVDEIRVSPGASDQTFQEVCDRCRRFGVTNVNRSVLTESYS